MIAVSELDSDFDLAWLGSTWTGLGRDSTRLDLIGVRWSLRHLRGAHYTALYTCPCTYLMARALCAACMKTSGTISVHGQTLPVGARWLGGADWICWLIV